MSAWDQLKKQFWWWPFGCVPEISANELHRLVSGDKPVQIVDVRSAAEWRRSHIPGAVSVPIGALKHRLAALQVPNHHKCR